MADHRLAVPLTDFQHLVVARRQLFDLPHHRGDPLGLFEMRAEQPSGNLLVRTVCRLSAFFQSGRFGTQLFIGSLQSIYLLLNLPATFFVLGFHLFDQFIHICGAITPEGTFCNLGHS